MNAGIPAIWLSQLTVVTAQRDALAKRCRRKRGISHRLELVGGGCCTMDRKQKVKRILYCAATEEEKEDLDKTLAVSPLFSGNYL